MQNIFTIPASRPFQETLAKKLMGEYGQDPLFFSNITIFLPNRRACKAMAKEFLRAGHGKPMLLPKISPLGDIDEDEIFFNIMQNNTTIPNVISSTRQRLILTGLIEKWQNPLQSEDKITTPQAAQLAIELASFLGEVEKQQLSFAQISNIVPEELSRHWQLTLDFLNILIDKWPQILEKYNAVDIHMQRNITLKMQADYWQKNPPPYPVIAAGSTGSIPATAHLLKTIAAMPNGKVILPGLDKLADQESWDSINQTHPQYILKQLIEYIGIKREDVADYIDEIPDSNDRCHLISELMRPAATTEKWKDLNHISADNLKGIQIINAPSLQSEATVIALKMKEVAHIPGKTAALITNQRDLAANVSGILKKWDIIIDDSAGSELCNTTEAVFLRLIAQMVHDGISNPTSFLNCLKHPYSACGFNSGYFRANVRKLEITCLRGVRNNESFTQLYTKINDELATWLKTIEECMDPLLKLMNLPQISLQTILLTHLKVAEQLATNDKKPGNENLWGGMSGEQLKEFFDEFLISAKDFKDIKPQEYLGLVDAMLAGQTYRPAYGTHPRLFILSPIEARMLHFDLVILGELNEGSWPNSKKSDPWMSRPMRDDFGLPLPEKRIGQSAHDFAQLLAAKNVVITRSEKLNGTQTIPSRWLMRLNALLRILRCVENVEPKEPWLKWAELLNRPQIIKACDPPAPNPPINVRPNKLSVTAIETLMRDPYSIYAKNILKLRPLEPIDKEPSGAEFGIFIHNLLETYFKQYNLIKNQDHFEYIQELARNIISEQKIKPTIVSFWWPRFERIAKWFIENERIRRKNNIQIFSEIGGEYKINAADKEFTLHARADRIETDSQNNITIIDYKTGTIPSDTDVLLGLSPQMTLEALIANNQGFFISGHTVTLEYWKLSGGQNIAEIRNAGYKKSDELEHIINEAEKGVKDLILNMFFQESPFLSCPNSDQSPKYNDYEHLARIKEWG
jgi:ATP-dependent helicase/nuclease subunit B